MKKSLYLILLTLTTLTAVAEAKKPNIMFILIDDFGWYDVGYNGSTFYETPQIDRLAKEWMRFDNCYTPSPMCSPTRTSILTGKNPARHGVTQWLKGADYFFARQDDEQVVYCPVPKSDGIKESEVTLGETFRDAGYDTAFFGKWHMGSLKETGGPKNHGYDSQKAIIETNSCNLFNCARYFPGKSKKGDCYTDLITDEAIDFVTTKRDQPFYLHLCHFAMHARIESKPELRAKFAKKAKQLGIKSETALDDYSHQPHKLQQNSPEYAGELYNLDENIGRLVDALKESGQYENTIIIFTGDNGGRSTVNKPDATSVMSLRGGKTFLFEGGLRTPLLIHWPGHSAPGSSSDVQVTSMDFYPSLLEMTGLAARPDQHVDGVSLVPLFTGDPIRRNALYWHFPHYQGEGSYPASAIRIGDFKLIHNYHHKDVLLFNLSDDPHETKNLATTMPEKTKALQGKLMEYLKETKAYRPKTPTPDQKRKRRSGTKERKKG
ncbi:MAG: sulfatase [Verrucomicrobiales bacterium]|nr:sulfatase [Verrucomicrobiales bacterium]